MSGETILSAIGKADLRSGRGGVLRRRRQTGRGDPNAIGRQRWLEIEQAQTLGARLTERVQVTPGAVGARRRRRLGRALAAGLADAGHAAQCGHRAFRKRIAGDAGLLERGGARSHPRTTDEGRDDGNRPAARGAGNGAGHGGRVRRCLRSEQHQGGIDDVSLAKRVEGVVKPSSIGVAHEVNGIGHAGCRRQHGSQPRLDVRAERGDDETGVPGRVSGDDAESPSVRHHGQTPALRHGLPLEGVGQVEQRLHAVHTHRASLLHGSIKCTVGPGQRAGVRGDGAGGLD